MKKILYVDMDNVLVDFRSAIPKLSESTVKDFDGHLDDVPGIFSLMEPIAGAIASFEELSDLFDTYILSTAPWKNPTAWSDKLLWVQKYLGKKAYKRLIISHHKHRNMGDFLIDDRLANGADKFTGELVQYGSEKFPDWKTVMDYMKAKAILSPS